MSEGHIAPSFVVVATAQFAEQSGSVGLRSRGQAFPPCQQGGPSLSCTTSASGRIVDSLKRIDTASDVVKTHNAKARILRSHGMLVVLAPASHFAMPAKTLAVQTVVDSEALRDPDLVLADRPPVRIGMFDGLSEYLSGITTGAIQMEDVSVVVVDEQSYEVRKYDASGRHVRTSG